jgi:hypothetical protein
LTATVRRNPANTVVRTDAADNQQRDHSRGASKNLAHCNSTDRNAPIGDNLGSRHVLGKMSNIATQTMLYSKRIVNV